MSDFSNTLLEKKVTMCNPGVLVADWDSKKLEEPFGGLRSNLGHDRGNLERFGFCLSLCT